MSANLMPRSEAWKVDNTTAVVSSRILCLGKIISDIGQSRAGPSVRALPGRQQTNTRHMQLCALQIAPRLLSAGSDGSPSSIEIVRKDSRDSSWNFVLRNP